MVNRQKKPTKTPAPRAWQRMLSGRRLDLLAPSPLDVELEDIALGLARVARWNGQTSGVHGYSVAEHSLLVEQIAVLFRPTLELKWRLAALLHDAPEYVVGDLISPFKAAVGIDYRDLEDQLMSAIHLRFGLPARLPKEVSQLIKRADHASAYFEAIQLAGFSEDEARKLFKKPRMPLSEQKKIRLKPLSAADSKTKFVRRATTLLKDLSTKL